MPLTTLPDPELLKREGSADKTLLLLVSDQKKEQCVMVLHWARLLCLFPIPICKFFPPNAKHSKVSGNVHFA